MSQKIEIRFVKIVLLINGLADLLIAFVLIFFGEIMGATTSLEFYIGGSWGIAAIALGLWRIWAFKKRTPEILWFTAAGALFEGSILTLYSFLCISIYNLNFMVVFPSIAFGLTFVILYAVAFILKSQNR